MMSRDHSGVMREKMERIILVIPAASFQKGRIGKALSGIRKHLRIASATMYMQTQSRGLLISFLHWMAKRFRYGIVWVIQKQQ